MSHAPSPELRGVADGPHTNIYHRLHKALLRRPVELAQYCAHAYQKLVKQFGMEASMSRRGDCFDNAPIESFWGLLKNELVYHRKFATRAQAQKEITEYIEIFCNRQRTQERLNYLSPAAFAQRFPI